MIMRMIRERESERKKLRKKTKKCDIAFVKEGGKRKRSEMRGEKRK